jgi:hypothetical protein
MTTVYAWNPINRTSTPPWGFFHHDEKRLGVAPGTPPCGSPASCIPSSAATNFFTIVPCRAVDTRSMSSPALSSGVNRTFAVGPACGVPAAAKAVSVNVTVTLPTGSGTVQFAPAGCTSPPVATSIVDFSGGQTRSNNAILLLATDGGGGMVARGTVGGGGTVQLIVDVNGYFQ